MNARTHFVCTVDGCGKPHDAKGLCRSHYKKLTVYGDVNAPAKRASDGSGWIQHGYKYFTVNGRNTREHVMVVERVMGKPLPPGAIIHHADEDRSNNDPSNLVVCPNHKYHHLLHVRMRAKKACGNANWRKCPFCGQYDDPNNMSLEGSGRCVHRECSARAKRESLAKRKNHVHV